MSERNIMPRRQPGSPDEPQEADNQVNYQRLNDVFDYYSFQPMALLRNMVISPMAPRVTTVSPMAPRVIAVTHAEPPMVPRVIAVTHEEPPMAPRVIAVTHAEPPMAPRVIAVTNEEPPMAPRVIAVTNEEPPMAPRVIAVTHEEPPMAPRVIAVTHEEPPKAPRVIAVTHAEPPMAPRVIAVTHAEPPMKLNRPSIGTTLTLTGFQLLLLDWSIWKYREKVLGKERRALDKLRTAYDTPDKTVLLSRFVRYNKKQKFLLGLQRNFEYVLPNFEFIDVAKKMPARFHGPLIRRVLEEPRRPPGLVFRSPFVPYIPPHPNSFNTLALLLKEWQRFSYKLRDNSQDEQTFRINMGTLPATPFYKYSAAAAETDDEDE